MEIKKLEVDDLVEINSKIYRVIMTKWANGEGQGMRAYIKLLRQAELNTLILEK